MHWLKRLKAHLPTLLSGRQAGGRFSEPLSAHTTLRIGGPADLWLEPKNLVELKEIVCSCLAEKLPYFAIGRGSNILASDKGFKGAVISLNTPAFTKMGFKENYITCGGGLPLEKLIREAQKKGLGGLEFLAGIPATAAGALVANAGNQKKAIGKMVKNITVMDKKGNIRLLKKKELRFGYRKSSLNRYIVLEAQFELVKRTPKKVEENIAANLEQKRKTQDLTAKSAGCIFKNPFSIRHPHHRLSAGKMIEACGLKQRRRGGAEISAKHANYIINRNGAKAKDILYLMGLAQREVKKKFGVFLEPEIRILR